MGSMIYLSVGRLEVDWGKNHGFTDHSALYQQKDVSKVPYHYAVDNSDDDGPEETYKIVTEYKEGLSKPLWQVVDRLNLLGYTLDFSEKEFLSCFPLEGLNPNQFNFRRLCQTLKSMDLKVPTDDSMTGEDFEKFFQREIYPLLRMSKVLKDPNEVESNVSYSMGHLSAYTIIQLLSLNSAASNLPVEWSFNDLEVGGWAKRNDFIRPPDKSKRFLIVTEGSSDAAIIRHALSILRPHIEDFFDFVDMEEGYPFSGTGSLVNFVKGLISISVQNNVIVLFDNDAEGVASYTKCINLNIPENMKILKLPDCSEFEFFQTIGPNGQHLANINGQGAAIECYLDLGDNPILRWNNYNPHTSSYQGELIKKDNYKRAFLGQRKKNDVYNYSKIEAVLNMLINNCVTISEAAVLEEWDFDESN